MYNLTDSQKDLLRWIVEQVRKDNLNEEFHITWSGAGTGIISSPSSVDEDQAPEIKKGALDALAENDLLICERKMKMKSRKTGTRQHESSRRCTLTGRAYDAVDSDFDEPDTSFVKHLSPLADVTNLDSELKERCLPILGAGASDPQLWDSATRTAGVVLEERLREVGGIDDSDRVGRTLVNDIFGQHGTLADEFESGSERQGFRDLYAGIVGAFRNPSAHRLVDPSPEDGGAYLVFVNLLLRHLEEFRDNEDE